MGYFFIVKIWNNFTCERVRLPYTPIGRKEMESTKREKKPYVKVRVLLPRYWMLPS